MIRDGAGCSRDRPPAICSCGVASTAAGTGAALQRRTTRAGQRAGRTALPASAQFFGVLPLAFSTSACSTESRCCDWHCVPWFYNAASLAGGQKTISDRRSQLLAFFRSSAYEASWFPTLPVATAFAASFSALAGRSGRARSRAAADRTGRSLATRPARTRDSRGGSPKRANVRSTERARVPASGHEGRGRRSRSAPPWTRDSSRPAL